MTNVKITTQSFTIRMVQGKSQKRRRKVREKVVEVQSKLHWIILPIFILVFILRLATSSQPQFVSGTKIKITGTLRQEPKQTGGLQSFSLAGIKIKTWRYPEYHYGERLEVVGVVKNNSLEMPEIKVVEERSKKWEVRSGIFDLRKKIEVIYQRALPEPYSGLLAGIVLGSKSGLPTNFYLDLQKTGVMHVVVASGMNVSILAGTLISFLVLLVSRKIAITLSLLLIWFYVLLAGGEIPVIRAGIMGSLTFLALGLGREQDAWRGLFLAAAIILLFAPLSIFDLGFQLSFMATFGILFFGPGFSNLFKGLPKQIRNDLAQTLGAQIATLPIIILNFGTYSFLSPLVNLLVVFVLPWIMRLGLGVAVCSLISLGLGQIFAWLALPFLVYFVWVVRLFGRV